MGTKPESKEPASLLDYVEAIDELNEEILVAAQKAQWSLVKGLESKRLVLIAGLKRHSREKSLSTQEVVIKTIILKSVLANSLEIKSLEARSSKLLLSRDDGKRTLH